MPIYERSTAAASAHCFRARSRYSCRFGGLRRRRRPRVCFAYDAAWRPAPIASRMSFSVGEGCITTSLPYVFGPIRITLIRDMALSQARFLAFLIRKTGQFQKIVPGRGPKAEFSAKYPYGRQTALESQIPQEKSECATLRASRSPRGGAAALTAHAPWPPTEELPGRHKQTLDDPTTRYRWCAARPSRLDTTLLRDVLYGWLFRC